MAAALAGPYCKRTRPPCCAGVARLQAWARLAPWPRFRCKVWQACRRRHPPACPLVLSPATPKASRAAASPLPPLAGRQLQAIPPACRASPARHFAWPGKWPRVGGPGKLVPPWLHCSGGSGGCFPAKSVPFKPYGTEARSRNYQRASAPCPKTSACALAAPAPLRPWPSLSSMAAP